MRRREGADQTSGQRNTDRETWKPDHALNPKSADAAPQSRLSRPWQPAGRIIRIVAFCGVAPWRGLTSERSQPHSQKGLTWPIPRRSVWRTDGLSPHLQIYKMMFTMVMSGLHRITGMCLYLRTLLLAWYFIAVAWARGHSPR